MKKIFYVCKYTPTELLTALGGVCENLNTAPENFDRAEEIAHPNLCGFGKAVLEAALSGDVRELILVNCCDTIRSVYDLLEEEGNLEFLYMLDVLHSSGACSRKHLTDQLLALTAAYCAYRHTTFQSETFQAAFTPRKRTQTPHLAVLGARMSGEVFHAAEENLSVPLVNETCVFNRSVDAEDMPENVDFAELMDWYAGKLLEQIPCMRMQEHSGRRDLYEDPALLGILYHTVKFCDFYSFEYAAIRNRKNLPILKLESDFTVGSSGQLRTRVEAFAERIQGTGSPSRDTEACKTVSKRYFAGIDSGSTSTDVVIINEKREMIAESILPTGAGAALGAERALDQALEHAGLQRKDICAFVATGYGRTAVEAGDKSITEITCHARGAYFLDPDVRTVIDIGGQDSKVIRLDEHGTVTNFAMNDKCAAGTGRFLEMMAGTLEMTLDEIAAAGLRYHEDITISSMCTVFAESEVVSLIAQNKAPDDIVHGLNKAVASKTAALVHRVGGEAKYMMTGGVAQNKGLVRALEERLEVPILVSSKAQLCGALGAALYAQEI